MGRYDFTCSVQTPTQRWPPARTERQGQRPSPCVSYRVPPCRDIQLSIALLMQEHERLTTEQAGVEGMQTSLCSNDFRRSKER